MGLQESNLVFKVLRKGLKSSRESLTLYCCHLCSQGEGAEAPEWRGTHKLCLQRLMTLIRTCRAGNSTRNGKEWLTNSIVWVALWCNDSCPINWISRGLSVQWRTYLDSSVFSSPSTVSACHSAAFRASASNFRLEHYVKYKNSLVHALKCHMHCNPGLLSPLNEAGHSRQTLSIIQTLYSSPWLGNLLLTKDKQTLTQRVK